MKKQQMSFLFGRNLLYRELKWGLEYNKVVAYNMHDS